MIQLPRPGTKIAALLVLFLVIGLNAIATWHQANTPWLYTDSDHANLLPIYYKLIDPTRFSQDYVFKDSRYFGFYTPSFFGLVRAIAPIGGDYFHAVALLQTPILLLYLAGAYALFWQVSHSQALALVFALLSIVGVNALIDFWLVNSFYSMLPRTLALPGVVWSIFLLLRYLGPVWIVETSHRTILDGRTWWHWLLLGTLIGITANLHPTTGIVLALVVGLVTLASWRHMRKTALLSVVALIAGALIASAPIVFNVVGQSARPTALTLGDFHTFVTAFKWRITVMPMNIGHLSLLSSNGQVVVGLLWLPLTLIPWLLMKPNCRSWAALVFLGVQLVYAWLLVQDADPYLDLLILLVVTVFFLWRWWVRDEGQETIFYEMMAAIIGVSFFLVFFLRILWLNLEIWSLTTLVAELTRGARLLTVPFFLIGARFAFHIAQQHLRRDVLWLVFLAVLSVLVWPSVWHLVLLALLAFCEQLGSWRQKSPAYEAIYSGIIAGLSVYIIYQIVTQVDGTMLALMIGASVSVAVYGLSRLHVAETVRWLVVLIGFAVVGAALTALNVISPTQFTNDSPWYVHSLRGAPDFVTFLLGGFAGLGLWLLFRCTSDDAEARRGRRFPPEHIHRVAASLQRFDLFIWLCISLLGVMVVQTPGLLRLSLRSGGAADIPLLVQAAQWAQANTAPDALFYDTAGDGSEFRLWSLRSVTHGWKELGLVGYSQPLDLAPLLERYRRIVAHSDNAGDVLAMASELGADYIIGNRAFPLDLPVSYSNQELVIYQVGR